MTNPILDLLTEAQRTKLSEHGVGPLDMELVRVYHHSVVGLVAEARLTEDSTSDVRYVRVFAFTSTGQPWDVYTVEERDV